MSALPFGSALPGYNAYNTGFYNPYGSSLPFDSSAGFQPNPYAIASFPSYVQAPVVSAPESKSDPNVVRKVISDETSLEYFRATAKNMEETIVAAASKMQLEDMKLAQKQREEYAKMYHAESQVLLAFNQKLDAVRLKLPKATDEKLKDHFPTPAIPFSGYPAQQHQVLLASTSGTGATAAPQKTHPMIDLKALQERTRRIKVALEAEVKAELASS
jgi:hypothetical protein